MVSLTRGMGAWRVLHGLTTGPSSSCGEILAKCMGGMVGVGGVGTCDLVIL